MKKSILLVLSLFIIFSCNDTITESPTEQAVENLNKKPQNPPNTEIEAVINNFSLGGIDVIEDNVVVSDDFDIDITDAATLPRIKFRVTNSIPFQNIRIRIFYDANADNYELWNKEFNGYIYNNENIGSEDLYDEELKLYVKDVDFLWNGSIEPLDNDPVYGSDFVGIDSYVISDQLATIYTNSGDKGTSDRFGIKFEVHSGERGENLTRVTSFMWLTANAPLKTFHVEDIKFDGFIPATKGKIRPTYRVKVVPEPGSDDPLVRRRVWVDYSGIYEFNRSSGRETTSDGWTIINGPALKITNKTSGELTLTVKSVNQFGWTYNPSNNTLGSWNGGVYPVEPSITISIPDGLIVP